MPATAVVSSMHLGAGVPRSIHQTFKYHLAPGNFTNPIWEASFTAWRHFFPEGHRDSEYSYTMWSDAELSAFFEEHCQPVVGRMPYLISNIFLADIGRYCVLWKLGGIYADLDYEPRANFYNRFAPDKTTLVESPYAGETFQNSLMSAPPGQPFLLEVMRKAHGHVASGMNDANDATGPRLLDVVIDSQCCGTVARLPCQEFHKSPHPLGADEAKGCGVLDKESVHDVLGIHWGTCSWCHGSAGSQVTLGKGVDKLFQELFLASRPNYSLPSL